MNQPPLPPGSVVVGFDGSTQAVQAAEWAATFAHHTRRPLVFLHAVSTSELVRAVDSSDASVDLEQLLAEWTSTAQQMVQTAAAEVMARHPDLEVRKVVMKGDARQVLLDATQGGASMVVVGSRGRGPVRSLLLGSVSSAVARHATCPVVVVRPHHPGNVRRGVLAGVDANPDSLVVAESAFQMAAELDLPLTVLHVLGGGLGASAFGYAPVFDDSEIDGARRQVSETLAGLGEKYPEVHLHVDIVEGSPWQCLVERSAQMNLLVVGRHQRSPLEAALHGPTTLGVVEHASCPVLAVPVESGS